MSSTRVDELVEPVEPLQPRPAEDDYSSHDRSPRNLGLALTVISAAQLMIVLDSTIVNIALPHLMVDLGFTEANLSWVVTIYTLAFGGLLLLGGRLGDLYGRRRLFTIGILLFGLASLVGGVAANEELMLGARVLQGLAGALAAPNALALITTTFPAGKERTRAMGVYAAMSGVGAAIGLILGGALTEADWRWTFFINVPIGLLVAFLAPRLLTESEDGHGALDIPGALTSVLGLGFLTYGLTRAGRESWSDSVTIGCLVAGVVLLAVFALVEMRTTHPLLPLRILADRTRGTSFVAMLVVGAAMFAMFYFLGLYIQQVLGYSALKTGFAFLPFSVSVVAGAQVASALMSRVDPRWIAGAGGSLAATGMWGYSHLEVDSTYWTGLFPWIVVQAIGMGMTFVPLTLTAVHGVDHRDSSVASAVLNTMQQVGGTLGLATLSTVAVAAVKDKVAELSVAASLPQGAPAPSPEQLAAAKRAVALQAQTYGSTQAFLVAGGMMLVAAVVTMVFLTVRHRELAHDGAEPGHLA